MLGRSGIGFDRMTRQAPGEDKAFTPCAALVGVTYEAMRLRAGLGLGQVRAAPAGRFGS
jgi:hypothetical protein